MAPRPRLRGATLPAVPAVPAVAPLESVAVVPSAPAPVAAQQAEGPKGCEFQEDMDYTFVGGQEVIHFCWGGGTDDDDGDDDDDDNIELGKMKINFDWDCRFDTDQLKGEMRKNKWVCLKEGILQNVSFHRDMMMKHHVPLYHVDDRIKSLA